MSDHEKEHLVDEPLHTSFYHFVCDANVRDNGSSSKKTVEWVLSILDEKSPLVKEVEKMQSQASRLLVLITACNFLCFNSLDNFKYKQSQYTEAALFQNGSKDKVLSMGKDINIFRKNIIEIIAQKLEDTNSKQNILKNDQTIFYEGGTLHHAIAFYLLANDEVVICNSGDGLINGDFHIQDTRLNTSEVIARFKLAKHARWLFLATIIICGEYDRSISFADSLYALLRFLPIEKIRSNPEYYFESQISGSCTFWSTFYAILFQSKWNKQQLEETLLKAAGKYFIELAPKMRSLYGYNGLISCVATKFEQHNLKDLASFVENEYKILFENQRLQTKFNDIKSFESQFVFSSGNNFKGKRPNKDFTLEELSSSIFMNTSTPVFALKIYIAHVKLINKEFDELNKDKKKADLQLKMYLWSEVLWKLNEHNFEKFCPNFQIHLKQLILVLLLVLNDTSTKKMWKKSSSSSKFWPDVKKHFFACGIKDKRIAEHEDLLSKYDCFWKLMTSPTPLEISISDYSDALDYEIYVTINKHAKNVSIKLLLIAWILPCILLCGAVFAVKTKALNHQAETLDNLVTSIAEYLLVDAQKNMIFTNDEKALNYKSICLDKSSVSFQTNEFFDLNNLLIDRIVSENFTEEEMFQNLPFQRTVFPYNKAMPLIWPLAANQFSNDFKSEFDSARAKKTIFPANVSITILAFLCTLFYLNNDGDIPIDLTTLIEDKKISKKNHIFFKDYVRLLNTPADKITPKNVYDMISNKTYLIGNTHTLEYFCVCMFLSVKVTQKKNITHDFLSQLLRMYNQTDKLQKIEALYPQKKLAMDINHNLVLDGHSILAFHDKFGPSDMLMSLAFYSDEKMHFYLPEDQELRKNKSASKFFHTSLLNSKRFTLNFQKSHFENEEEAYAAYRKEKKKTRDPDSSDPDSSETDEEGVTIHAAPHVVQLHEQILYYDSKIYTRCENNIFFWTRGDSSDFLSFKHEQEEIVIFPKEHFAIEKTANEKRYLLTPHKKYLIVYQSETNAAHQRFLTFPRSLILYDDEQNMHLLFLCHAEMKLEYKSPWTEFNRNGQKSFRSIEALEQATLKYYINNQTHIIIPIASNSSHLIFQDAEQALCYLVLCMYFQDVDGLYLHFKQLVYLLRTCDAEISNVFKAFFDLFENSFNNPYSHYFKYIWTSANVLIMNNLKAGDDYVEEENDNQWPSMGIDDPFFAKPNKPDNGHFSFEHQIDKNYETRKSKYPAVFQFRNETDEQKTVKPFNKDQKKLMDDYSSLLETNIFNILNRNIDTKHLKDEAISAWSKSLDGKEICQLHDSNKKAFRELKFKINGLRQTVNQLEYELTLKVMIDLKRVPLSQILQKNNILLSNAMVTRIVLNTLELLDELDTCQMINKYTNYLKRQFIYDDERPLSYLYLEYMLGFFVRKDQHQFLVTFGTKRNNDYIMLQELLMGLGKTSVVLPLLTSMERSSKTFIVVPKHMHKESYLNLARYSEDLVLPLVESSRERPYKNIDQLLDPYIHKWLMDDTEFKRMALNKLVWKNNMMDYEELNFTLSKTAVIIDEFDLLYNPAVSVLQYPIGELQIEATGLTSKQWINILRFIFNPNRPLKNVTAIHPDTFAKGFSIMNELKLNQHYGFSNDDLERLTVVPYAFVNKPIEGSSFSNILLQFLLTFEIYANLKSLQLFHVHAVQQYIVKNIFDKNIKSKPIVYSVLKKIALQDRLTVNDLSEMQTINKEDQIELLQTILTKKLNNKLSFQHFNFKFVKNIVLPNLGDTYYVASISFLEAIYRDPFSKIYAFSGTTNLILPEDEDLPENKQIENMQNKGAIHYAIVQYPVSIKWNTSLTNLQNLIELATIHKMNCFMDAGAFLLGDDIEVLLLQLSSIVGKNILFFSPKNGDKLYITNKTIMPYRFEILPYDSIIVYDQGNCIGVNVKQYIPMMGFISLNEKVSQYEFIAQAIFRLRNINHGHSARLVTKDKAIATVDILQMLHENSNHFVKFTQEPFRLFQTMTYKSKLPMLRPKFSELRFQNGNATLADYVKTISKFKSLKEYDAYIQLNSNSNSFGKLQTQKDTTKQKSTEQEQQNENNDSMLFDCNIMEALRNNKKTSIANKVLTILREDFNVIFDVKHFELLQFAACFEPYFKREKPGFIADTVGTLRATNPYYYNTKIKNGYAVVSNHANQTNNTDEKKTNVFLRWLSGAVLSYEQQLELDLLFLRKSNALRILKIINCFNAARTLKFGNVKRIKELATQNVEDYLSNLQTDHSFAEKFEFYDHKLLKKLITNSKKRKVV